MRLTGYQPQYFPRLHYLARVLDSDVLSISDNVQYVKAHSYPVAPGKSKRGPSYQADTVIKSGQGIQRLTVGVRHTGQPLPINATPLAYEHHWPENHLGSIQINYSRALNSGAILPQLQQLLATPYTTVGQLNTLTILWALAWVVTSDAVPIADLSVPRINELLARPHPFRLRKVIVCSQTDVAPPGGDRDAIEWIIETCQHAGADEYYVGGTAAAAYIDADRFAAAGIKLVEQNWTGKEYTQQHPRLGFIPNLSIIDLLMNEPQSRVGEVLQS